MTLPPPFRARFRLWTGLLLPHHHRLGAKLCRSSPLPLPYVLGLRSVLRTLTGSRNVLCHTEIVTTRGEEIPLPLLQKDFAGEKLGDFSLDAETVQFLWSRLAADEPRCIMEFGSGLSTVMLARYAQLRSEQGLPYPRIVSVDQRDADIARTRSLLERSDVSDYVKLLLGPLDAEGRYQVAREEVTAALDGSRVDWFLIDGPFGPTGCRVHTLGQFQSYGAPRARWYLDDSFRDSELSVLTQWRKWPSVSVTGVFPVGKGLASGVLGTR